MYESFGFQKDAQGNQSITLFIPDNTVDPTQYDGGEPSGIAKVSIVSDFQSIITPSVADWDPLAGLPMVKSPHPNGWLWIYPFPAKLPDGFYQYLFAVQFDDGTTRTVGDPCNKYGGTSLDRSGFVVGGAEIVVQPIQNRLSTPDLQIYELMIDDFTLHYRTGTPIDAVIQKLDGMVSLGVNAIEFMPWTAWPDDSGFSWGYNPAYFFSVEDNYVNDPNNQLERLTRLANLVTECHQRKLHVFQDIVLQHAAQGSGNNGFPYYWLWKNPTDSPFVGQFTNANNFGMLPLDYSNACTQQFIVDVCIYWLKTFQLDGLRFDEVTGFTIANEYTKGAPAVIASINQWLAQQQETNVSLILEDSWGYDAVGDANAMNASGAWFDMFRSMPFGTFTGFVSTGRMSASYMRTLNSAYQSDFPISPVIYIENHDHSTVTYCVGGRAEWAKTQPYLIALATCPGAVMIHNGQEWGQVEELWEDDTNAPQAFKRIKSRPLDWTEAADPTGIAMRAIYTKLLTLRQQHPGLRSPNFYPNIYDQSLTQFEPDGFGIDVDRQLVIYHRYGAGANGNLERFIVTLNFTGSAQSVNIPFPIDGVWTDLINGNQTVNVNGNRLMGYQVPSNWGCVFRIEG